MFRPSLCWLLLGVILMGQSTVGAPPANAREEARLGTFNLWDYIYDIWTRHYSSHISSYWSSSDYSSVVNQWLGATQKMVVWAFFGTFMIIKAAWVNGVVSAPTATGYRGFGQPTTLTEEFGGIGTEDINGNVNYTFPYLSKLLGMDLTFPIDNSLQDCYKGRETCVKRDFGGEVDHLVQNFRQAKDIWDHYWLFTENVKKMVIQGDEFIDEFEDM